MRISQSEYREMQSRLDGKAKRRVQEPRGEVFNPKAVKPDAARLFIIKCDPVPAPRMTRRDKWLKPRRPCVQRYFDFRDFIKREVGELSAVPSTVRLVFHFPMPDSWSFHKKAVQNEQKHRQRPDVDNCIKAVLDALFEQDGGVSDVSASKRWCVAGAGRIEMQIEE